MSARPRRATTARTRTTTPLRPRTAAPLGKSVQPESRSLQALVVAAHLAAARIAALPDDMRQTLIRVLEALEEKAAERSGL
jgi:hypothetical protein